MRVEVHHGDALARQAAPVDGADPAEECAVVGLAHDDLDRGQIASSRLGRAREPGLGAAGKQRQGRGDRYGGTEGAEARAGDREVTRQGADSTPAGAPPAGPQGRRAPRRGRGAFPPRSPLM